MTRGEKMFIGRESMTSIYLDPGSINYRYEKYRH